MNLQTRERLFGFQHAFDHPLTVAITLGLVAVLLLTPLAILVLWRRQRIGPAQREELVKRYISWLILIPLMLVPILLGAAWTMAGVLILSCLCYGEFARATGLFREKIISLLVALGILAVTFAVADHWYNFFMALFPLTVGTIAAVAILPDRPQGYIQRVALGAFSFTLFGACLSHLGYIANDPNYRPILLWMLLAVEANDVFAYICGKTFGRRKLAPNTSPNKTIAGALGALLLTTSLAALLGHFVFAGTALDDPLHLVMLGIIISTVGQLGDLMLSSIKRDLGIKDMAATIPGHGGWLDRFNSLILVAPAVFHFVHYFGGFEWDKTVRIITGD